MKNTNKITLEFMLVYPDRIERQKIKVLKGEKLYQTKKYLNNILLNAWNKSNAVAIDTEIISSDIELTKNARIIILRKLISDPKQLRRNRAKKG